MSSRSPQSHKNYDGSPNWWPDHHQHQLPRALGNIVGRQSHCVKARSPCMCASKNRVSRFAVLIADFYNKIGTNAAATTRERRLSGVKRKKYAQDEFFSSRDP